MEQGITFTIGAALMPIGLSFLFRARDWAALLKHLSEYGSRSSLMLGIANVLLGCFIVGFHWKWRGLAFVLTVIGMLALIKGLVYLLFPNWLPAKLKWLEPHYYLVLPVSGLILIGLSLTILCEWQKLAFPGNNWYPSAGLQ